MYINMRISAALKASAIHLIASLSIALVVAGLVFGLWYPHPYLNFTGGRELFLMVVGIDVVCGPFLTLILFSPFKHRSELIRDVSLIVVIQFAALGYGVLTAWNARPLYLAQEIDRFKIITSLDLDGANLDQLPVSLRPSLFSGPLTVAIRSPINEKERELVMIESVQGGRDYAERPEFYLPYDSVNALKSMKRARPIALFLQKRPEQVKAAQKLALERKADITQWMYLPVIARQDWVAVLNKQGQIQGFLKGDGF